MYVQHAVLSRSCEVIILPSPLTLTLTLSSTSSFLAFVMLLTPFQQPHSIDGSTAYYQIHTHIEEFNQKKSIAQSGVSRVRPEPSIFFFFCLHNKKKQKKQAVHPPFFIASGFLSGDLYFCVHFFLFSIF